MQEPPRSGPSFLILHGIAYDGSADHWHNRLSRRLADRGCEVRYPRLPAPDAPRLADWLGVLHAELRAMEGSPGDRVVICHSLGCLLWIHAARELALPADRLLLVAPPEDGEIPSPGAGFAIGRPAPEPVRASSLAPPRVVRGELDPYSPSGVPAWALEAGCEIDRLVGVAHINPDDGHGPWPSVERWCMNPATRLEP